MVAGVGRSQSHQSQTQKGDCRHGPPIGRGFVALAYRPDPTGRAGLANARSLSLAQRSQSATLTHAKDRPSKFETARARSRTGAGNGPMWRLGALVSWL